MADVTPILISQLSAQTTLQDTDYFIVGGDDAKKITVAQMKEALGINTLNTNMRYFAKFDSPNFNLEANTTKTVTIPITGLSGKTIDAAIPVMRGGMIATVTLVSASTSQVQIAVRADAAASNRMVSIIVFWH